MINIAVPVIDNAEIEAVIEVLKSGILAQGLRVEEFERNFANYIGTKYAVAVNSGTAALHIALLASGIGPGDEVITTTFSFIASSNAILFCGAKPIFVDIDERTFNIDPVAIRKVITPKTKAIVAVHLYGQPCVISEVKKICGERNLILIEDACQAHGAEYNGKKVGSFGIGCFSFYPTKNMTTGEGGMITTNDETIVQKAKSIRSHGQSTRYFHEIIGYNYRMTDIAAAIGLCQLRKLDEFNIKRIDNAKYLSNNLSNIDGLKLPFIDSNAKHVFHQYTIRVTEAFGITRDELQRRLKDKGISTGIHYPMTIHKQPLYDKLGYKDSLPVAERAAKEVLSLPIHPSLTEEDLENIVNAIKNL